MPDGVSVIICCHNSAPRLPETLAHLAAQKVDPELPWEVLIIDNASKDDTSAVAQKCWTPSPSAGLRVVAEPEAGLSHARTRGIREARYDLISFIDDDNWVAPDWVERVHALFSRHPDVGACGGRIEAVCEVTPPAWFESVRDHYAVGRQHAKTGDITDVPGTLLWGAGLSVRTSAVRALFDHGFKFRMSDRKGRQLSSGGDTELCFALRAAGWRFWYDDDLVLKHFIPEARLQWAYALRLMRGIGECSPLVSLYLIALDGAPFAHYPAWKKTWLFQFAKMLRQSIAFFLIHPWELLTKPPGSITVLQWEGTKRHLASLWRLRRNYVRLRQEIRQSAWVQPRSRFVA